MNDKIQRKVDEGKMYPITLQFHEGPVTKVYINEDQTLLFSSGNDQRVNIHSLFNGEQLGQIDTKEAVKSFVVTKDSEYIVIGGFIGTVYVYRIDGTEVGTFRLDMKIFAVEMSYGDDKFIIVSSESLNQDSNSSIGRRKVH